MKSLYLIPTLLLSLAIIGCTGQADQTPAAAEADMPMENIEWSYEGEGGPDSWGSLDAAYSACATGMEQSPIALISGDMESVALPPLMLNYGEASLQVEDTGHGFKATPDGDHTLTIEEDSYSLLQFHAHTPSEHTLDGTSYPMAVHFVHQNDQGQLAVIGVLIESGEANPAYAGYADGAAGTASEMTPISVRSMLPASLEYFTYSGSLTTPPCSEGVRWIVLKESITLSAEQIEAFASEHGMTNRPVQPLEGRVVQSMSE